MTAQAFDRPLPLVLEADIPRNSRIWVSGPAVRLRSIKSRLIRMRGVRVVGFLDTDGLQGEDETPLVEVDTLKARLETGDLVLVADPSFWFQRLARLQESGIDGAVVLNVHETPSSFKTAYVFDQFKVIYVPVYKVASSSVLRFFAGLLGCADRFEWVKKTFRSRVDLQDSQYGDHFKFSIVRDPWDRTISCFQDKFNRPASHPNMLNYHDPIASIIRKKRVEFRDFVEFVAQVPDSIANQHWRSQHLSVCKKEGEVVVDYLAHLETLEADFEKICSIAGLKGDLGHFCRSSRSKSDHRDFFSDNTLTDLVRKRYAKDIAWLELSESLRS